MIRNMEKNKIAELTELIPIRDGAVVSLNLARQTGFEVSLYSFGKGESITEQVSFGDTFYWVLGGKGEFGVNGGGYMAGKGYGFMVPCQTPHFVNAVEGLQLLLIQVSKKGEDEMFIKNFVQNQVVEISEQIALEKGKIVSKSLVQRDDLTMTLFAFDEGEGVSTHAAAGDAMVVVLEGSAEITVDGVTSVAQKGQSMIMPANIPHSVKAVTPYKMLLIVVKPERP